MDEDAILAALKRRYRSPEEVAAFGQNGMDRGLGSVSERLKSDTVSPKFVTQ
jgi:hypothetical protein